MRIRVKNVHAVRRKSGAVDYYYRPTGVKLCQNDIREATRLANALNVDDQRAAQRRANGHGTMEALIRDYAGSSDYTNLARTTQKDYGKYLDHLKTLWGEFQADEITREVVLKLKQKHAATPRKADMYGSVLSKLFAYALDRPAAYHVLVNPALRSGRMSKPEGRKPWPDALLENFRKDNGDIWRAVEFILNSGQRVGDAVAAKWEQYDGRGLYVKQSKTGAELFVPFTAAFRAVMDDFPKRGDYILAPTYGTHWKRDTLIHEIAERVKLYGFDGYSLHGLRYLAAGRLAEAGCTPSEIAAITGHKTLTMIRKYSAKADQRRLANSAVAKLEGPRE